MEFWFELWRAYAWLMIPLLVTAGMFLLWLVWGREPLVCASEKDMQRVRELPPAYLAALLEQRLSHQAITATVVDWMECGLVELAQKDENLVLSVCDVKKSERLAGYERRLWGGFFPIGTNTRIVNQPSRDVWQAVQDVRHLIYQDCVKRGWFRNDPAVTRALWLGLTALVVLAMSVFYSALGERAGFSIVFTGTVTSLFAWSMPQRTKEGARLSQAAQVLAARGSLPLSLLVALGADRVWLHSCPTPHPTLHALPLYRLHLSASTGIYRAG